MVRILIPSPLEITYLLECRNYPNFGYAEQKRFLADHGLLRLLTKYPNEFLTLKGKKSGNSTIEEFLVDACSNYIERRFYRLMQTYHAMAFPEDTNSWNYSAKISRKTIVHTLNYLTPKLQAIDPSYNPPDIDLEQVFEYAFTAEGKYTDDFVSRLWSNIYGHITKRELLVWAQEQNNRNDTQIIFALFDTLAQRKLHPYRLPEEHYNYIISDYRQDELKSDLAAMLQIIHGSANQPATLAVPTQDISEEDKYFIFEISTGCEAEQCSSSINVGVSIEELLQWADSKTFCNKDSIAYELEEWFKERDNTEEDDHLHDYDYGQDGYEQVETMVSAIARRKKLY